MVQCISFWKDRNRVNVRLGESPNQLVTYLNARQTDQGGMGETEGFHKKKMEENVNGSYRRC